MEWIIQQTDRNSKKDNDQAWNISVNSKQTCFGKEMSNLSKLHVFQRLLTNLFHIEAITRSSHGRGDISWNDRRQLTTIIENWN